MLSRHGERLVTVPRSRDGNAALPFPDARPLSALRIGKVRLAQAELVAPRAPQLPALQQRTAKAVPDGRLRKAVLSRRIRRRTLRAQGAARSSPGGARDEEKRANDKERAIGLLAAPLATLIGFLVIHALVANDPPAHLTDGAVNKLHVNLSTYHELFLVLIVLSFLMLRHGPVESASTLAS